MHGRKQQTAIPTRQEAATHTMMKATSKTRNETQSLQEKSRVYTVQTRARAHAHTFKTITQKKPLQSKNSSIVTSKGEVNQIAKSGHH
mgnify:CR=1 FL=1